MIPEMKREKVNQTHSKTPRRTATPSLLFFTHIPLKKDSDLSVLGGLWEDSGGGRPISPSVSVRYSAWPSWAQRSHQGVRIAVGQLLGLLLSLVAEGNMKKEGWEWANADWTISWLNNEGLNVDDSTQFPTQFKIHIPSTYFIPW